MCLANLTNEERPVLVLLATFCQQAVKTVIILVVIIKLPWPGDCEGIFRFASQVAPAHLSITRGGGFTMSLFKLNIKQESCEYQLLSVFDLVGLGMEPRSPFQL